MTYKNNNGKQNATRLLTPTEVEDLRKKFYKSFVSAESSARSSQEESEGLMVLTTDALKEMIENQVNASLEALGINVRSISVKEVTTGREGLGYKRKELELLDQMALKRQEKTSVVKLCEACLLYHPNPCLVICGKCNGTGHRYRDCEFMLEDSEVKDKRVYTVGRPQCNVCKEILVESCSLACPGHFTFVLESEFWNLKLKDDDLESYTKRFLELSHLSPRLMEPEYVQIARYIWGLPEFYQSYLTSANKETLDSTIEAAKKVKVLISLKEKVKEFGEKIKSDDLQGSSLNSKKTRPQIKCFRCRNFGHLVKNCPVRK